MLLSSSQINNNTDIVYLFTLSTDKQSFTIMTTSASMMMEERLPHNEADEHVSIDASDDDTQETSDVAHAQDGEWYPHNGVTHGNHTTEVRLGRQVSVACTHTLRCGNGFSLPQINLL